MKTLLLLTLLVAIAIPMDSFGWGFSAHKQINKTAIFTLPPEMFGFYKKHWEFIEQNAVNPDKRRTILKEEACRHFIDLDVYPDSIQLPRTWKQAILLYNEDSLRKHGIVPWHIQRIKYELTEAFRQKAVDKILRLSADLGHYAADANVPLHTTANYNGQLTNQHGIHGLWESRLPELFSPNYDLFIGRAVYLDNCANAAWNAVNSAHAAVDSVLSFEKELTLQFPSDQKYTYEERNGTLLKVYSEEFSLRYHAQLNGQVERRMRAAILFVGSLWYTCWVDAGQPDLNELAGISFEHEKEINPKEKTESPQTHEQCTH